MAVAIASGVSVEVPTKEDKDSDPSNSWKALACTSNQRWEAFRERRAEAYKKIARRAAVRKKLSELSTQERVVHRSMPLELLAREWLNEQRASIESRAYLVDKVLPTLVIGVEKLLDEVGFASASCLKFKCTCWVSRNNLTRLLQRGDTLLHCKS